MNRVHATLHHLKMHKAADCIECEGKLWWFLTPGTDNRICTVEMRADVEQAIAEYLAARMPGVEVMSWNTTVFEYSDMKLVEPPHVIRQDHKVFSE